MGISDDQRAILLAPGVDRLLAVLQKRHRRLILMSVRDGTETLAQDLLVRGESDGRDARAALQHTHLAKLEKAGFIEWERGTGVISRGPLFEEIEPLLDLMAEHDAELPADWP